LLVLYGIRRNCHNSERNLLLYQFIKRVISCNNYREIFLLSTAYKILSNILLARLTPYVSEITRDHQSGFHCNRSTTHQIFYIRQILEKMGVHKLFLDFKKAYDSIKREVLCNILLEFVISNKLVRLIKMCLNETYGLVSVGKRLSDTFPVQNALKKDALSPLHVVACCVLWSVSSCVTNCHLGVSLASSVSRVCVGVHVPWFVCNTCVS
jgi:hypothetical protein